MFTVSGSSRRILNLARLIKPKFLDELYSDILAELECPEILGNKILFSELISWKLPSRNFPANYLLPENATDFI